jgi:hypothetical protein
MTEGDVSAEDGSMRKEAIRSMRVGIWNRIRFRKEKVRLMRRRQN